MLTPKDYIANGVVLGAFKGLNPSKTIQTTPLCVGTTKTTFLFKGEIKTDCPIVSDQYGNHTFLFEFDDQEDLEALKTMDSLLADTLVSEVGEEWVKSTLIKNDAVWMKMPIKNNVYTFTSNMKLNAKKPKETVFHGPCELSVGINVYFSNNDIKRYGLSMSLQKAQFKF